MEPSSPTIVNLGRLPTNDRAKHGETASAVMSKEILATGLVKLVTTVRLTLDAAGSLAYVYTLKKRKATNL